MSMDEINVGEDVLYQGQAWVVRNVNETEEEPTLLFVSRADQFKWIKESDCAKLANCSCAGCGVGFLMTKADYLCQKCRTSAIHGT